MEIHEEKRKITRVDYPIRAQAGYQGKVFWGEIMNVSLNGLMFMSDEPMDAAVKERVSIVIDWGGAENALVSKIECIVVRKADRVLGLRFDVIDGDTLMLFREKMAAIAGDKINEEFIGFITGIK